MKAINEIDEFSRQLADCWIQPQRRESFSSLLNDADTETAFLEALQSPVGFHPPLADSVFAGDRIAIVLQDELPRPRLLLECLLKQLMATNIEPTDITVVVSALMARRFGLELKSQVLDEDETPVVREINFPLDNEFQSVRFQIHDAEDEQGVAYIAASEEGLPVKVNRTIVDADVILPVGCPDPTKQSGLSDCIYPTFCSLETQRRYQERKSSLANRMAEIALANDHLGSFFLIQVVAGPGGQIQKAVSGERSAVRELANAESEAAWQIESVDQADMAIATIETDSEQQSWKDFARAVVAANSVANGTGPIFVWSEINERPKSDIQKALNEPFESSGHSKLSRLMQQLADIVAERQVFLKSKLSRAVIEDLGLGFVDSVSDLSRLIDNQASGVLLRDAHKCQLITKLENQDA